MTVNIKHSREKELLSKYFPLESTDRIIEFINVYNIKLRFTNRRLHKLGDYKPPARGKNLHHITVNRDLNPYSALLVFLHELGHLLVWSKYKNKVKPHGKEWKEKYGQLIKLFVEKNVFPLVLKRVLEKQITSMRACFMSDPELYRTLHLYDNDNHGYLFLEGLPEKSRFKALNGKTFIKLRKLRKRFRCICLENQRIYLFNPLAKIKPINKNYR